MNIIQVVNGRTQLLLFPLRSFLLHILLLHSSLLREKVEVALDALYEAIRCTKGEICMWMTPCIVRRGEGGLVLAADAESQPLDDRLIGVDVLLIDGCAKKGFLLTAEDTVVANFLTIRWGESHEQPTEHSTPVDSPLCVGMIRAPQRRCCTRHDEL